MKTRAKTVRRGVYTFTTYGHQKIMIVLSNFMIESFNDDHLFHHAFTQYKLKKGIQPDHLELDGLKVF